MAINNNKKKRTVREKKRWHCTYWIFICHIKHTSECSINKGRMNMCMHIYVPRCNEKRRSIISYYWSSSQNSRFSSSSLRTIDINIGMILNMQKKMNWN